MMSVKKICPAIISANFNNIDVVLSELSVSNSKLLHIDVIDGNYASEITFGHKISEMIIKKCTLPSEIHLSVSSPINIISQYTTLGASTIIVPVETTTLTELDRFSSDYTNLSLGLSLKPNTPVNALLPYLDNKSLIKITLHATEPCDPRISVNAILKKIQQLKDVLKDKKLLGNLAIQLDGGLNSTNISTFRSVGVDEFVMGSAIFKGGVSICENINKISRLL